MMSQEMLAQNTYTKKNNKITLKLFCVLFLIFLNIVGYCLINSLLRQTVVSFIEVKSATWISLSLITVESLLSFIFNDYIPMRLIFYVLSLIINQLKIQMDPMVQELKAYLPMLFFVHLSNIFY